ncbi:MAG: BMP family ABC transporter substrate-binding protein [Clostridiales bacterium GWB2_37_7]|nr:MAG: BMP family ABC transporter substrate-binding protein [Clostridiales bacterium GWB2_37_7]
MKKSLALVLVLVMVMSLLAACSQPAPAPATPEPAPAPAPEKVKVGMVTDSGTIDDKSFNQGTWEGILKYKNDKNTIEEKYLQPTGEQPTDYVNAINDLVDTGYSIVVTPGFKFETAINEAAANQRDTTFILIDGQPHNGDFNFVKHDNVVSIFFNEHEAGFLAGVASALSTKTGKLGFVGGMEIPPVQRFGWGFKAGVAYANKTLGTKAEIVDYLYQGTFNDVPAGQTLAAGMYNKGVDIIFHAAGGVGVGVFNEAKQRAEKGEKVFVVGVDVDQYAAGEISNGSSVTLTSAMKRIDVAAYNYIDAKINGTFPGGEVITLSLADNGVGLPEKNPNLTDDVIAKVEAVKKEILSGAITVPGTQEALDAFLK